MTGRTSRLNIILVILRKDLYLMFREKLFIFLSLLSIVFFVGIYWVLPDRVNESISMGIRGVGLEDAMGALAGETQEGLGIDWFPTTADLRQAVESRDVEIGIDFPDGFIADVAQGNEVTVTVFARANLPAEISFAMSSMIKEIAYALAGHQLPVSQLNQETLVVGPDLSGEQLPLRDQMRPMYAFMMLIMEAMALGTLIAAEVQNRTVVALLATPAHLSDILAAKGIIGTLLAFTESALIMVLIRGFGPHPEIVLLTLFLGAMLVTSTAMISGSAGKDLVATMLLSLMFLIPLAIPAFSVLFPGTPAAWIQALPTYSLVRIIVDVSFNGAGWAESAGPLLSLAGWCAGLALLGVAVLGRRVKTL